RAATGQPLKTEEWAMARALATGKPAVAEEIEIERFDGSGRATIINAAAPILDAAGKIIGGVVAEIDVTAQVRAEELARAAMERTARAEDQLRHAQKLEAVGQLAGGVAHDFNNLLTVIIASSEYLADELPAGSPLREEVDEVKKASDRASALVRQLLAFSRKQVLEPRVVDVNELLRGLERLLARLLSERHALAIRPASDALLCTLDAGQFEQVLVNLVVNSRDAMPTGGNIVIEADQLTLGAADVVETPGLQPGPHVRLVVTDDGSGIPLEVQARVFEPFFTTKGPDRGTGLGLATVYGIVKQSGGAISFTSEPGRGTRFTILFPRAMAGSTQPAPSAPGPAARAEANETVLLVEDDTQVRQAVEGMLRRAGYRVLNAANGDAAVKVSEGYAGTIDVLLTDVIMPGVSGRKLAEKLRAQRPGLRVLFMSGYSDDELARDGTLDPDVQFIRKPLTNEALLARLRKVLRPASSPLAPRGETPSS
ncbi:MAG TPA: ATP-binding protein, partial [Archangium sp.]